MTKQLIDSSGEMHTYATLVPLNNPQHTGWRHLRITTVYDAARNPEEEQTRFDMCLSPEAFEQLQKLFKETK